MIYYYAHTGHKIGLERLRRSMGILKGLEKSGQKVMLLVNDFRAGLVARELGCHEYVTIEGVQDIDAIATHEDSIIIDSIEDDHGRLVKYCSDFEKVWRFAHDSNDNTVHGETLIDVNEIIVDDKYFEAQDKEEKVVFFLGDSDHDKMILNHVDFFQSTDMELILGNYFFVKYEDDLAKIFQTLHEPEEYDDLITTSSCVVTASTQTAFEAKASGAKVIFLNINENNLYSTALLEEYGVIVVNGFDTQSLQSAINTDDISAVKNIERYSISNLSVTI